MADVRPAFQAVEEAATPRHPSTARAVDPSSTGGASRQGRRFALFRRERVLQVFFLLPAVVYLLLFFGAPVVRNVIMGFQNVTTASFYTGEAPWVGLDNYANVVRSSVFSKALTNTLLFTIGSIAGQFAIGLGLALFFRRRFPLSGVLRSMLLLPWLFPLIVSSAIWRWMLDQDNGVLNQILGTLPFVDGRLGWLTSTSLALIAIILVNIWIGIPFNAILLYGGLQDIPEELYEAAAIDGASGWQAFRDVTWPLLRPVVNVVLILGIVFTLKVLDIILALTGGGPANATQTIATQSYYLSFRHFDFGQGAALSNILIVISLTFAILYLLATRRATHE